MCVKQYTLACSRNHNNQQTLVTMVATATMVDIGTLETFVTKLTMVTLVSKVTTKMLVTTVVITVSRPSCTRIVAVILFGLNQN